MNQIQTTLNRFPSSSETDHSESLLSISEFDKIISTIIQRKTPHNFLLHFHFHRIYSQDNIADKKTFLQIIDDLKEETPVCNVHRFEGKKNNQAGLEERVWFWTFPFVYQIDNWTGISMNGDILSFVDPVKQTTCSFCDQDATLVLLKTKNPKDVRLTNKKFDNENAPMISSQIELESLYENEVKTSHIFNHYPVRKDGKKIIVLSHGLGKDSMTEFVLNWKHYDLIIFADTGNEQPETYEFLKEILEKMPVEALARFVVLSTNYLGTIYEFYWKKKLIPMPMSNRTCTDKFKIRPIRHFLRGRKTFRQGMFASGQIFEMAICINYSEQHRARGEIIDGRLIAESGVSYIQLTYPLIDKKVERKDEAKIILEAGYNIPVKSGCVICPFTSAKGFNILKEKHPDDYQKVIDLVNNSTARTKLYNLKDESEIDAFFDQRNQETKQNRCSCFNGTMATEEEMQEEKIRKSEENDKLMRKGNKW